MAGTRQVGQVRAQEGTASCVLGTTQAKGDCDLIGPAEAHGEARGPAHDGEQREKRTCPSHLTIS